VDRHRCDQRQRVNSGDLRYDELTPEEAAIMSAP
jgi:hypothetical protein